MEEGGGEGEEAAAATAAERSSGGAAAAAAGAAAFFATTPETRSTPKHVCSETTSFASSAPSKALAAAWAPGAESLEEGA